MLSQTEQLRYSRQSILQNIGDEGQLKLKNAKVMIVGVGGLGNPVSLYLNAAGIGHLFLVDGDQVDASNLPRQVIFNDSDIGENKADIAAEYLQQQNSNSNIEVIDEMLDAELADYYFPLVDIVLDCTDNIATRYLINEKCFQHKKPLIIGSGTGFDGQLFFFEPNNIASACYQCLLPANKKIQENNCQTLGILGPVLSIIGGGQALETIKLLTGNKVNINQLSLFDGLNNTWQKFAVKKQDSCRVCN